MTASRPKTPTTIPITRARLLFGFFGGVGKVGVGVGVVVPVTVPVPVLVVVPGLTGSGATT
jgi:hypothetical protein